MSTEWQTMDTAPKEGAQFLAYCDFGDGHRAFMVLEWTPKSNGFQPWLTEPQRSCDIGAPTHWMPLPPPPTELAK